MQEDQKGCKNNIRAEEEQVTAARMQQQEEEEDTGIRPAGSENKETKETTKTNKTCNILETCAFPLLLSILPKVSIYRSLKKYT